MPIVSTLRSRAFRALSTFAVGLIASSLALQILAQAHFAANGWFWTNQQNPPYALLENRTSSYGFAVSSAGIDYNNNTDLHVDQCADNGQCGNIVVLQGNYGATGWSAFAHVYRGLSECNTYPDGLFTGNCNRTDRRADFGYVYFNDFEGPFPEPQWGARHEIGHVFGMIHTTCTEDSVMRPGVCYPNVPSTLTLHDIDDINRNY